MDGSTKILMTADVVGGVWSYAMNLCRSLQEYDVEIHLMAMGGELSQGQRNQLKKLPNVVVYPRPYKLEWMDDPWDDLKSASEDFISLYNFIKPDLIHFNNFGQTTAHQWECPVVTVFHSCVLTWWEAVKREPAPESWNRYKEVVLGALQNSDLVVAPSESILQAATSVYGKLPEIAVIHNGFTDGGHETPQKQNVIMSAGRFWDQAKNIAALAEVAPKLPWPVLVAGEGTLVESSSVIGLGKLEHHEVMEQFSKAAIFTMPALYEPFGLAALEAAASSCALVLADIPTFREVWGDAALYFNPRDATSAVHAISRLCTDDDLRIDMGKKAAVRAGQFTALKMAAKYLEVYQKLIIRYKQTSYNT